MGSSIPQIILDKSLGFQRLWADSSAPSLPHVSHKQINSPIGPLHLLGVGSTLCHLGPSLSPSLLRLTKCALGLVGIWGWGGTGQPELSCPAFNSLLGGVYVTVLVWIVCPCLFWFPLLLGDSCTLRWPHILILCPHISNI